jgi:hypothetical protein
MPVNTTKAVTSGEVNEKELQKQIEAAAKALGTEKKVFVSIPKNFLKHTGPTVLFGINGVQIVLPVDGKEYEVPFPFKALVQDYVNNLTN